MDYKILSLDETGKAHYHHPSKLFVISGCVVKEKHKAELRLSADKIIFKYWGDKNIIFHSADMFGARGDFSIFKDKHIEKSFWSDFVRIIIRKNYLSFYIVTVDKIKAKINNWQVKTIVEKSYGLILSEFVKNLAKSKYLGRVQSESSTDQDVSLITAHSNLQRNGVGSIKGSEYFKQITCLSLVTKGNHDIETQLSDIMATVGKVSASIKDARPIERLIYDEFLSKTRDKNNPSILKKLI